MGGHVGAGGGPGGDGGIAESWTLGAGPGRASAGRSAAPGLPGPLLRWAFRVSLRLPRGDPFSRGGPGACDLGPPIEGCPQHKERGEERLGGRSDPPERAVDGGSDDFGPAGELRRCTSLRPAL
ncbi:hypothetical protein NDU88_005610 [Pleurodeles waltl]|uniref:Uncharacterized protein n=1 Tax=Pleurodeles waltl TaxID=8319 RepID=A0AAV7SM73_PLEWA|nr:hypothetical protein NDU88_005610 [Pleurodeles waltl]